MGDTIEVHNGRRIKARDAKIRRVHRTGDRVSFDTTAGRLGPYPVTATVRAALRR